MWNKFLSTNTSGMRVLRTIFQGIVGVIIAYTYRRKIRKLSPNTDCNDLDKGQRVVVEDVLTDGSAKVNYRGALWTAYLNEGNLTKGTYFVEKVEGTRLILTK